MNILGQEFEIVYRDCFHPEDADMGKTDTRLSQIIIRQNMNQDVSESTVLHEVIHVISEKLGLELSEAQVLGIESGLYSVGYRLEKK